MSAHDATYVVGVDWDNDLFMCLDAQVGDELNLVPTPITLGDIFLGVADDATQSEPTLNQERTDYGIRTVTCVTGTGTTGGLYFGADPDIQAGNTIDDIPVSASTEYTMVVWLKGVSSFAGVDFALRAYDQSRNTIATSSTFTLTSAWVQHTLTFTTGVGDSYVALMAAKSSSATDVTFQAAGLMLVAGDTAPSGFNAGNASNLYDNIESYVMDKSWFIGSKDEMARSGDEATCDITLNNSSKLFSPENASGALYGAINPNRRVKILCTQNGTEYEMWNGYIDTINVDTGQYRTLTTVLTCRGTKLQADDLVVLTGDLFTNVTADEVLMDLLVRSDVIPASDVSGFWRLGVEGYSEIGISTILIDTTELFTFETGIRTFSYVGDKWDTSTPVFEAARQIVEAEQGWLHQDRTGKLIFYNRHHYQSGTVIGGTINETWQEMEYSYGSNIVNSVSVTYQPRSIGGSTDVLWALNGTIEVIHKETYNETITYTDDSGATISALNVIRPTEEAGTFVYSGGTGPILNYEETGTGLILNLESADKKNDVNVTTLIFYGTKLTSFDLRDAVDIDGTSIVNYGRRHLNLNLSLLDDQATAVAIARYYVQKYKDPTGIVPSVTLVSKDQATFDLMLGLTIGDRVRIIDTQSGHDATHIIIGEEHTVTDGSTLHTTVFYCIPALQNTGWLLGEVNYSELGETTIIGF